MIRKKILEAYENLTDDYNAKIDFKPHNAFYDRPNTLKLIGEVKDKSVLDAACGPGKYAEILISKGATITGFDISPRMIALAKARNKNTPPTFIVNASNDKAVPVMNSILFYQALQSETIYSEIHIYPEGGHGFGLAIGRGHLQSWVDRLSDWMESLN